MNQIPRLRLLACVLVVVSGCSTDTATPSASNPTPDSVATKATPSDDPATYKYHRNVEFTEVSKNIPDGSVDHFDFNMAVDPNVIVVVTVTASPKDNLRFTTTFTGPNDLSIVKEWKPAGAPQDDEHVGLFILPAAVTAGSTVVH